MGIPFISQIEDEHKLNKQQAKALEADALYNAAQRRKQGDRLVGEQIASFGASGVELDGTPLDMIKEDRKNAEIEAMNIVFSGKMQSAMMKRRASLQKQNAYLGLATTALTLGMSSGAFKGGGGGVDAAGGTTKASKGYLAGDTGGY